jgi:hypothetical protein
MKQWDVDPTWPIQAIQSQFGVSFEVFWLVGCMRRAPAQRIALVYFYTVKTCLMRRVPAQRAARLSA